jgi:membrane-associated protease RseP (regulator of RpoE activity)
MDMVGRLDEDRRLAVYGVGTSPSFIPAMDQIEQPKFQFKMDSSGVGPSDHTSFYIKDIPVLHFFTGQHAQYHRPEDDVELINFEGLYDVSNYIEQLIISLDQKGKLVFTKTRDKEQKGRKFNVTLGIVPDYLFSGIGLKVDGTKEGRPAAKYGIVQGDVIIKIGDIKIEGMNEYIQALNFYKKGDKANVIVLRDDMEQVIRIEFD